MHYRGADIVVCKSGFVAMHGINRHWIDYAFECRKTSSGTAVPDQTTKTKITVTKLVRVHEHIQRLPVKSSHYTRAKSPHRKYLGSAGSISQYCITKYPGEEMVSSRIYRTIFSRDYNIDGTARFECVCVCIQFTTKFHFLE